MASRARPIALAAGVTLGALAAATAASWYRLKRAEHPLEARTRRRLRADKASTAVSGASSIRAGER